MRNEIVAFAQAQAKTAVRRAAIPTAFALTGGIFVLFAIAGLFSALFFWLEPEHGPLGASLILAAVALVLALLAFLPLVFRRRPPPPPPQDAMLPQFVSLMARTAPGLGPRQIIFAAALVAVALVFTGRSQKR
jgi:Putative Actinobacterial Holin-X, holin superfamily III